MTHLYDLSPEQLMTLRFVCEDMDVDESFQAEGKVMQEHCELTNACQYIRESLDTMMMHADQFGWDLRDHNIDDAVDNLERFAKEYGEVLDDMNRIMDAAMGMVAAFRDLTQCGAFELTCPDEEIKAVVDQYLTDDTQMGISYQNGKFVLVFGQVEEESYIQDPIFVKEFATGNEEAIANVNRYVMTLMEGYRLRKVND